MKNIAERLTHAREAKGWSKSKLAAAAGVTPSAIGNIESGIRQAKASLHPIAKALGVNYDWLANGIGEMASTSQQEPVIPYTGPSSLGRELALVFDMIPESEPLKRAKAYALATSAIVAVLQGENVALQRESDK
jgi:transcriptional regulator with XRE-family HTH domain